jgi:hypothetical protein
MRSRSRADLEQNACGPTGFLSLITRPLTRRNNHPARLTLSKRNPKLASKRRANGYHQWIFAGSLLTGVPRQCDQPANFYHL